MKRPQFYYICFLSALLLSAAPAHVFADRTGQPIKTANQTAQRCIAVSFEDVIANITYAERGGPIGTLIKSGDTVCDETGCFQARTVMLCAQNFSCVNGNKAKDGTECHKCKRTPIVDTNGDNRDDDCQDCCNDFYDSGADRLNCGVNNCT